MNILLPIAITDAMIKAGTSVPAIDAGMGEVAWQSGTDYALGDRRIYAGQTFECVKAVTGSPQNAYPPDDVRSAANWKRDENAPSNRMAPFDEYVFTAAKQKGLIKYVIEPGFFNGYAMYGVEADSIDVVLRERVGAGGPPLIEFTQQMWEQAFGEWEYLFGNLQKANKLTQQKLPLRPAAALEITLRRNDPSVFAELGFLAIGQWQELLAPQSDIGGTQFGAEVTPKSYSYFKRNDDGTYLRKKGRVAKNITASVLIDADQAPRVSRLLERIIDIPVAIEASSLPKYGHISTVGFVTGTVTAVDWSSARVDIKVDGNI